MYAIKTDKLTKYYGKSRGIIDVTLAVEEGDFFGFIGPNGAGKSTLIRTLLGLISSTSGNAQIFGKDIVKNKIDNLKNIGYLPSETMFYNGMKVNDILKFSANLRNIDCSEEASRLCDRLELDTTRKINELSLGNRKKVGIVCALQHKPQLYILDEPTSGLDPLVQKEFYSVLKERNEEGATIFLSSHVLSEISRYCKHAAVIREGKIHISDKIENMRHTETKRITLKGLDDISSITNAKNVTFKDGSVTFLYNSDIKQLLQSLAALTFTDINITDPDLDEVFMHYYTKEDK